MEYFHDFRSDFAQSYEVGSVEYKHFKETILDEQFVELFNSGPCAIFSHFSDTQPRTYRVLRKCKKVVLLEKYAQDRKNAAFVILIIYAKGFVYSRVVNKGVRMLRNKCNKILPGNLELIDKELHCYYDWFDGLSFNNSESPIGIENYNLPSSMTGFLPLSEFDFYSKYKSNFSAINKHVEEELLVFVNNYDGRLVLLNKDKTNKRMYAINYKKSNDFKMVENPINFIDEYCSDFIGLLDAT